MFACIIGDIAAARTFSPRVEILAPNIGILDLAGLDRLMGSPAEIARKIADATSRLAGARVAVAANPDAALCAARAFTGTTVVRPGSESRVLGRLPLALLGAPEDVQEIWRLWGLRTFRDLAALPEADLAARLGAAGVAWQRRARGALARPLLPEVAATEFAESQELEYPVAEVEPLMFVVSGLLHSLCAALESRGLAAEEIHLCLNHDQRVLRLPFPMRDTRTLLKLLQFHIEKHPPSEPVAAVAMRATPAPPRTLQHGLFLPAAPEPDRLEITMARIARLVGAGNVGSPELLDTHRPDAFRMTPFRMPEERQQLAERPVPKLVLRRFRPPLPARVTGQKIVAHGIHGRITKSAGPWRSSGDWWTTTAWSREEWDISIDGAGLYRIYRDLATSAWFVDGCYD